MNKKGILEQIQEMMITQKIKPYTMFVGPETFKAFDEALKQNFKEMLNDQEKEKANKRRSDKKKK